MGYEKSKLQAQGGPPERTPESLAMADGLDSFFAPGALLYVLGLVSQSNNEKYECHSNGDAYDEQHRP